MLKYQLEMTDLTEHNMLKVMNSVLSGEIIQKVPEIENKHFPLQTCWLHNCCILADADTSVDC